MNYPDKNRATAKVFQDLVLSGPLTNEEEITLIHVIYKAINDYEAAIKPDIERIEAELKEKNNPTKCECCGNLLDEDEIKNPRRDEGNNALCDQCYRKELQFNCPVCEDCQDIAGNQKHILVTRELAEDQEIESGIYKVIRFPWYSASFCSMTIYKDHIKKVLELPAKKLEDVGNYICEECFDRLQRERLEAEVNKQELDNIELAQCNVELGKKNERLRESLEVALRQWKMYIEDGNQCDIESIDSDNIESELCKQAAEALEGK